MFMNQREVVCGARWLGMAAAADSKILLKTITKKNQQPTLSCCCSICGKKLRFLSKTSEYPLTCWKCMIVNEES